MRAPDGGLVPDLAGLFQHGPRVVVDVDQAVVDRVGEGLDRDVAVRPGRGRFRPRFAGRGWRASRYRLARELPVRTAIPRPSRIFR